MAPLCKAVNAALAYKDDAHGGCKVYRGDVDPEWTGLTCVFCQSSQKHIAHALRVQSPTGRCAHPEGF